MTSETTDKKHISDRHWALDRQEFNERQEALRTHKAKFNELRRQLWRDCEHFNGHDYIDLPDNGSNRPHFITGEWPKMCKWCGMHK